MPRRPLPNRRAKENFVTEFKGTVLEVCFGFYDSKKTQLGEIFVDSPKIGSQMKAILNDASILMSKLLQMGTPPEELPKTMCREDSGKPSSILGYMADLVGERAREAAGDSEG